MVVGSCFGEGFFPAHKNKLVSDDGMMDGGNAGKNLVRYCKDIYEGGGSSKTLNKQPKLQWRNLDQIMVIC